ncbi:MAG TPA: SpoIIE family protein phosphatase [Terracidiphilus sp.]|jgi:serine phosphatase RsbU (regulator of sigma subunit)/catechol 2,3-dioxygenase-like lactoylglutathione lyase family enzyme
MADHFPLSGGWLTDRIVEFSQESDFRQHAETPAFRLNATSPYLRLHFVSVYVSDQDRSLKFFREKLGFTVVADARFASGNRWVEVSPPDGTGVLALVVPMKGFHEEHMVGNSGLVTFLTEDVDRTYREWSERGVRFTIPPQTPAWGGTFCRFVDPDGNSFALAGFTEVTRSIDERRRAYAEKLENERRVAQELEIARQVQARLFPQRLPRAPGLDYAGSCLQARLVGGDYYDFLEFGTGRLALIVGDIAGKGIAAALLMANLQANLRSQFAAAADQPGRLLASVNRLLFENTIPSAYATLFFANYDVDTGHLVYANCGHVPGLIVRAGGTVEQLDANNTVLGLFEDWEGTVSSAQLERGDLLALCTDGITESADELGEEFGQERLVECLRRHDSLGAQELGAAVIKDVLAFSGGRQFDDLTLIVALREG